MSRHIYDQRCPACKAVNWIDNGDVNDETIADVGRFKCWKCKAEIVLTVGANSEEYKPHLDGTEWSDEFDQGRHVDGMECVK